MNSNKPLLSIGIIFRDDIRSIEHCLKCLQPLRDAVPCELIMADTGSTDGSREVAEKYADLVFDFPWINDFAAARNAVMDRCTGEWYFSVDTDEYLREDFSELQKFLHHAAPDAICATVVVRNYNNYEMTGHYYDLMGLRLVRMSTGIRYEHPIHEGFDFSQDEVNGVTLNDVILDHDGYADSGEAAELRKKKLQRNLKLLRGEVEKKPENLLLRVQLLESSFTEPDYVDRIYQAVGLVKKKTKNWEKVGPSILRYGIIAANDRELPERDEWLRLAEEWFPESMYIRLDVEWSMFGQSWGKEDFDDCVVRGLRFLAAMADFNAGADPMARVYGTLQTASPVLEQRMKILLAYAYCCCTERNTARAEELLGGLDYTLMDAQQTNELVKSLHVLQMKSELDTSGLVTAAWDGIRVPMPSQKEADQREQVFMQIAEMTFNPENQKKEKQQEGFTRNAYTLYLPLRGKCEIGTAAAVLEETNPEKIETVLAEVDDWPRLPVPVLAYALEHGARFPLPDKPPNVETMDTLASRLAQDQESFFPLVLKVMEGNFTQTLQSLCWARGLALSALRSTQWGAGGIPEGGAMTLLLDEPLQPAEDTVGRNLAVARAFAQVEKAYLPVCYAPEMLKRETLFMLPPLHRFGWYCAQAFQVLYRGDRLGYVRLLREGLEVCEGMKPMVEFLLDHTPELQEKPEPSAELKALADQIRAVLANFSPDDPAVAALKQSEAYQKVAYLIEGIEAPVVGGLKQ